MTTILKSFERTTEGGNTLLVEKYQEKESKVPFWRICCNGRILRSWLQNRPNRETLERYAGIADANFGRKK